MLTIPMLDTRAASGAHAHPPPTPAPGPSQAPRAADGGPQRPAPSPHAVLDREVREGIDRHLAESGASRLGALDPADYSPEKVADRILGFVRNGIAAARANGADGERLQQMLAQAEQGVREGIEDARDILSELGVLNGKVAADVDRTEDRVLRGLERMQGATTSGAGVTRLEAASYEESRRLALEVTTRDGDTVTVYVARDAGASQLDYAHRDGAGATRVMAAGYHERSMVGYQVEGELDAGERKAVDQLLKRVDGIADRFYEGQTQAAFKQAVNLNYDDSELTGFSLSLRHTQTFQAVSAYRAVAETDGDGGHPGMDRGAANALGGFLEDLRALLERPQMPERLRDGDDDGKATREAVRGLVDERLAADPRADDRSAALRELLNRLTEGLVNGAGKEPEAPTDGEQAA